MSALNDEWRMSKWGGGAGFIFPLPRRKKVGWIRLTALNIGFSLGFSKEMKKPKSNLAPAFGIAIECRVKKPWQRAGSETGAPMIGVFDREMLASLSAWQVDLRRALRAEVFLKTGRSGEVLEFTIYACLALISLEGCNQLYYKVCNVCGGRFFEGGGCFGAFYG